MSDKFKRVLAIVGLVLMAVFSVFFVMFLFNPQMWGGTVAFIALTSGVGGAIIFLIIRMTIKKENEPVIFDADNSQADETVDVESQDSQDLASEEMTDKPSKETADE